MFGRRPDGRSLKVNDPIMKILPYLIPMRCDSQVMLDEDLDYTTLINYIAEQSKKGIKITFMELLIAAYVRGVSQTPEVNRFIVYKKLYERTECSVSFTLLMDTPDGSAEENVAKIFFDLTDTIYDVSKRIKAAIKDGRNAEDPGPAVKILNILLKLPGIPSFFFLLFKLLDRFGLIPKAVLDIFPFYTGLYVTNMASLGVNRVFHHIYNFGNTTLFMSLGNPKRGYTVDAKGQPLRDCKLPVGVVADERICTGFAYAKLFSVMRQALKHPETLEVPPESVKFGDRFEFHVEKPDENTKGILPSVRKFL